MADEERIGKSANDIIRAIRKNRQLSVTVGKFKFIATRPTDAAVLDFSRNGGSKLVDLAQQYVVDWEGVTENDLMGGGGTDLIPFDAMLWREWSADRPHFWGPIGQAIWDAYKAHEASLEKIQGN